MSTKFIHAKHQVTGRTYARDSDSPLLMFRELAEDAQMTGTTFDPDEWDWSLLDYKGDTIQDVWDWQAETVTVTLGVLYGK